MQSPADRRGPVRPLLERSTVELAFDRVALALLVTCTLGSEVRFHVLEIARCARPVGEPSASVLTHETDRYELLQRVPDGLKVKACSRREFCCRARDSRRQLIEDPCCGLPQPMSPEGIASEAERYRPTPDTPPSPLTRGLVVVPRSGAIRLIRDIDDQSVLP